jgi:hypothetical protein
MDAAGIPRMANKILTLVDASVLIYAASKPTALGINWVSNRFDETAEQFGV